jgi:hypothetical protein
MPYATGRIYCDADSHVMEPADWIIPYADPDIRPRLKPAPPWEFDRQKAQEILEERARDEEKEERARGRLLAQGTVAYGAWDASERSRVLDMLGFSAQIVFHTYAVGAFIGSDDPDVLYGGALAQNRALADFCSQDKRLMAIGYLPMSNPERALKLAQESIQLGCKASSSRLRTTRYHRPTRTTTPRRRACSRKLSLTCRRCRSKRPTTYGAR